MAVNYITAKLRKDKFKALLKDMQDITGFKAQSENSLIATCVFFAHYAIAVPMKEDKTFLEHMTNISGKAPYEGILLIRKKFLEFMEMNDAEEYVMKAKKLRTDISK